MKTTKRGKHCWSQEGAARSCDTFHLEKGKWRHLDPVADSVHEDLQDPVQGSQTVHVNVQGTDVGDL